MHSEANSPDNKELDLPKQSEKKLYAAKLSYNRCYRFTFSKTLSKRSELMSEFIKNIDRRCILKKIVENLRICFVEA